eukprot:12309-Eustigmatos_ZCMA.PRE.1
MSTSGRTCAPHTNSIACCRCVSFFALLAVLTTPQGEGEIEMRDDLCPASQGAPVSSRICGCACRWCSHKAQRRVQSPGA